jgi:hypothetical protein
MMAFGLQMVTPSDKCSSSAALQSFLQAPALRSRCSFGVVHAGGHRRSRSLNPHRKLLHDILDETLILKRYAKLWTFPIVPKLLQPI